MKQACTVVLTPSSRFTPHTSPTHPQDPYDTVAPDRFESRFREQRPVMLRNFLSSPHLPSSLAADGWRKDTFLRKYARAAVEFGTSAEIVANLGEGDRRTSLGRFLSGDKDEGEASKLSSSSRSKKANAVSLHGRGGYAPLELPAAHVRPYSQQRQQQQEQEQNQHGSSGRNSNTVVKTPSSSSSSSTSYYDADYVFDRNSFFAAHPDVLGSFREPRLFGVNRTKDLYFLLGRGRGGSGVGFHNHAEAWNVLVHGVKIWFVFPPGKVPPYSWALFGQWDDPESDDVAEGSGDGLDASNKTGGTATVAGPRRGEGGVPGWAFSVLPGLPEHERPLVCVQRSGDLLYLPGGWQHATMGAGEHVAIAGNTQHAGQYAHNVADYLRLSGLNER